MKKLGSVAVAALLASLMLVPEPALAQNGAAIPFFWLSPMAPFYRDPWLDQAHLYNVDHARRTAYGVSTAPFTGTDLVQRGIVAPTTAVPQNLQVPAGQQLHTGMVAGAAVPAGTLQFTMPRVGDVPRGAVHRYPVPPGATFQQMRRADPFGAAAGYSGVPATVVSPGLGLYGVSGVNALHPDLYGALRPEVSGFAQPGFGGATAGRGLHGDGFGGLGFGAGIQPVQPHLTPHGAAPDAIDSSVPSALRYGGVAPLPQFDLAGEPMPDTTSGLPVADIQLPVPPHLLTEPPAVTPDPTFPPGPGVATPIAAPPHLAPPPRAAPERYKGAYYW